MSKDWLEIFEKHLPPSIYRAIHDPIDDFARHVHLAHWHPISTVPCNQDVELRLAEAGATSTLEFPCLNTNAGDWINVDLGTRIEIQPVEWRVWQHSNSPQPHHSQVKPSDWLALLHHNHWNAERQTRVRHGDSIHSALNYR